VDEPSERPPPGNLWAVTTSRMGEQVGRVLGGRYRLVAPIGAGASGRVYLADDTTLRRQVAVKVLHEQLATDPAFLKRFQAEAQIAAALNHPHIVAVHDWGDDDGPYLVTEYLSGGSLRGILDQGVRLSRSQSLLVGLETSRALEHAHRRGLVHRDIKPSNLLFDSEGRLRIADFGLARALAEASVTEPTGAMLGTARYASPEQAQGMSVDGKSDVYSLALLMLESITGRVPFEADTTIATLMARVDRPIEPPDSLGPLQSPIARAGRIDPADRPDAGELAVAFMATAEALPRPDPIPIVGAMGAPDPHLTEGRTEHAVGTRAVAAGVATAAAGSSPQPLPPPEPALIDIDLDDDGTSTEKRRRWPWFLVLGLVLAAAGVAAFFAFDASQAPTHAVPDLVGHNVDDLPELIGESGWDVQQNEGRQDGTTLGQIIAQDPQAGTELAEGQTLTVTASLGNETVAVPTDLVGLPLAEAELRLTALGLEVGTVTRVNDEEVPLDYVIAIDEVVLDIPKGDTVDLIVSDGPVARTVPEDLAGLTFDEAADKVTAARLVPVEQRKFSSRVDKGDVISASPASGTEVPADSEVILVVSDGPEPVEVPDVEGMDVLEASAELEDAGLCIGETEGPANTEVLSTDPPAGEVVEAGTCVRIITRET
jgi:beta-lactam-binding protein with PASTA domain